MAGDEYGGSRGRTIRGSSPIPLSTIGRIERGAVSPTVQTLERLAEALGGRASFVFATSLLELVRAHATAVERALEDAETLILAVELEDFLHEPLRRAAGRDVLNRVRTAVQKLDAATLRLMPEVVADEIAAIRNLAVYDYLEEADELVYRTLKNGVPPGVAAPTEPRESWTGELPTPVPTRADGTLAAARPRSLCGQLVQSTGRPCLLTKGHRGHCRSR